MQSSRNIRIRIKMRKRVKDFRSEKTLVCHVTSLMAQHTCK